MLPTLYSLSLWLPRGPQTGPHLPIASFFSQLGLGLLEASSVLLPRALYFEAWFLSESFPTVDWIIPRTPFALSPSPLSLLSAESYLYSSWHASPQESAAEPLQASLLPSDKWEPWCLPRPAGVDQFSSGEGAALLLSGFPQPCVGSGREVYEAGKPPRNARCREVPSNGA